MLGITDALVGKVDPPDDHPELFVGAHADPALPILIGLPPERQPDFDLDRIEPDPGYAFVAIHAGQFGRRRIGGIVPESRLRLVVARALILDAEILVSEAAGVEIGGLRAGRLGPTQSNRQEARRPPENGLLLSSFTKYFRYPVYLVDINGIISAKF